MKRLKTKFTNKEGQELAARMELPANGHPHNYAIFAHCFTCNKNLNAIRNVVNNMTEAGFGVLSFDFTGLGESEGDFADTNFSSNVEDIVAAANFLAKEYSAPSLLIGHSLGGAAVLFATDKIDSIQAVATVGAPSNPEHVQHLIQSNAEDIEKNGVAEVNIGGRNFTIKKQFVDDLKKHTLPGILKGMRKSLLILHSPQDATVGIENAAEIYTAAHHPKSFISLDGADHLMTNKADSQYVGKMIASWAERYLHIDKDNIIQSEAQTVVSIKDKTNKFLTQIQTGKHSILADEPTDVGGEDLGPSPYQLLTSALGACTAMTMRMYADRKGWEVEEIKVHLNHDKRYSEDCADCEKPTSKIDHFERIIEVDSQLDEKQLQRLLEIANKCPVHRTLEGDVKVVTTLKES
ncbi:MAG: OsmC family protein [Cyclobacteriaceae bacterium]|nr:OsmC family protein [Cyclobacteriaceae bacterium]